MPHDNTFYYCTTSLNQASQLHEYMDNILILDCRRFSHSFTDQNIYLGTQVRSVARAYAQQWNTSRWQVESIEDGYSDGHPTSSSFTLTEVSTLSCWQINLNKFYD